MLREELLSVIIPVHNVENFLDECIKSIVNQTYANTQIILIDDGSEDSSFSICQKWAALDQRIECYRFEVSGGAVRARQKGIEMSKAEYVTYVDSDDWMEPDAFEKMMAAMIENDADIVLSTGLYCDFKGGQTKPKDDIKPGLYSGKEIDEICKKMIHVEIYPTLCNRLFRKSQHEYYQHKTDVRIKVNNDITCMLMTMLNARRVVVVDEYLYHYVTNNNSIVHSYRTDYLESNCLMYKLVREEMIGTGRDFFIYDWKMNFLGKLLKNIRLECSRENRINIFIKIKHIKKLYENEIMVDFIQGKDRFDLGGREQVMWCMVQRKCKWILYFYLKIDALMRIVFRKSLSV